MNQAFLPFAATAIFVFVTYRWVADEFGRERRLSTGAGNALIVVFLLVTSFVVMAALGHAGRYDARGPLLVGVGLALAAGGGALLAGAVWALASRERLLGIRVDAVVSRGPYRLGRHPFYVGWTIALLGTALAASSGVALTVALFVGLALLGVARNEERFLVEELGPAYEAYRRSTPALLGRPRADPDGARPGAAQP